MKAREDQRQRIVEAVLPPPMPTAITAVQALDLDDCRVTVPAVKAKLVQLRGFDASTKEVSEAVADYRDFQRQLAELAFERGHQALSGCAGANAIRSRMLREMVSKMWAERSQDAIERKDGDADDPAAR